jgi:hypothetical protein
MIWITIQVARAGRVERALKDAPSALLLKVPSDLSIDAPLDFDLPRAWNSVFEMMIVQ